MAQAAVALPYIVAAISAASAYMTYQSGQAQADIAKENKEIAEANARALQYQADVDAKNERKRIKRLLATQRMLFGKGGVTLEGTPLLVMEETAREGEKEAQMIQYAGRTGASRQQSQANIFGMQGAQASASGSWSAGATIGKGLLTAYDSYTPASS